MVSSMQSGTLVCQYKTRIYPLVQFTEALSRTTVTTGTLSMVDETGRAMPLTLAYDEWSRQVALYLREPLQAGSWYTVTVTSGVQDLVGNGLADNYVWSFRIRLVSYSLYLPLVLRNQ